MHERAWHGGSGLLLANRQLYDEVKSVPHAWPLVYSLAIFMNNESTITHTWTHVPHITRHIDRVDAPIYINGGRPTTSRRSLFDGGCGGPRSAVWPFFDLLQNFAYHNLDSPLLYGEPVPHSHPVDHTVGLLCIDIITPDLSPTQRSHPGGRQTRSEMRLLQGMANRDMAIGPPRHISAREKAALSLLDVNVEHIMTTTYLANFLQNEMTHLLSLSEFTWAYGQFLYKSIGKIQLNVDGIWKQEWDLKKILVKAYTAENEVLSSSWWAKSTSPDFEQFRRQALAARREAGLDGQNSKKIKKRQQEVCEWRPSARTDSSSP